MRKHERELVGRCALLANLPMVIVRRKVTDNPGVRMVATDNAGGLAQAFRHLKRLGHRRIGYLGAREPDPSRQSTYAAMCRQAGMPRQVFAVPVCAENNPFLSGMQMARAPSPAGGASAPCFAKTTNSPRD